MALVPRVYQHSNPIWLQLHVVLHEVLTSNKAARFWHVQIQCQNRISWGNSELTGAQWALSGAVLAYVWPKQYNMGQIGPRDIGADLAFGADLALFILQCANYKLCSRLNAYYSNFMLTITMP